MSSNQGDEHDTSEIANANGDELSENVPHMSFDDCFGPTVSYLHHKIVWLMPPIGNF